MQYNEFFVVNINEAGKGELTAELIPPREFNTFLVDVMLRQLNKEEYLIEYSPNEPGRYQLQNFI